ncbi:MAG TPA: hypothetical protein VGF97_02055 [Rhizomicrobium sp.]
MKWLQVGIAAALVTTNTGAAFAQTALTAPVRVAQGDSGGAGTSGGATSGGATSSAPAPEAPAAPAEQAPLAPGGEAGSPTAAGLSDGALAGIAAAALLAGVLIATTGGGHHGSTTTTGTQ